MKFKTILLLILTLVDLNSFGQTGYTRSNEYDRLRLSTSDLKKIGNTILYYYLEVPIDSSVLSDKATIWITCRNKGKAISLTTFNQISELNIDGEDYTTFDLDYTYRAKPISGVTIALSDYSRTLSVVGTDIKKVEALYRDIDDQLRSNEISFGWINWGTFFSMLVLIIFFIAFGILMMSTHELFLKNHPKETLSFFIAGLLICIPLIIFFISPISFKDIFPGFLLTNEKVPWHVKNALLISIIGIFSSLVTIYLLIKPWFRKSNKDIKPTDK